MEHQEDSNSEGKRVGAHPILVIFGVIIGLALFIQFIIPKSKNVPHQQGAKNSSAPVALEAVNTALVPSFKVTATIPEMNVISLVVPPKSTESQVIALLNHLRQARMEGELSQSLPPTTPRHELGEFAIADIYIFSDTEYGVPDAARVLARGAHVPGEFYPSSIPFEVAMEQVRGHYVIDLNNRGTPEHGSLGFGEESTGVYSKTYQLVF